MTTKIILLLDLLLYSVIAAQSFSYIISLKDVQMKMNANEYIVFRKLTDKNFRLKYGNIIYATLLISVALIVAVIVDVNRPLLICAIIALFAFLVDVIIMLKGNLPINNSINKWGIDNFPSNWKDYRNKWLKIFGIRQIVNLIGFVTLLIGAIFYS